MSNSLQAYWRTLACGSRSGTAERLLILLLAPISMIYSLIQRIRALLYRCGIMKTLRLPRPVVSVGNISVGGTGKTPVTAHIAGMLLAEGYRVAVLSRGYGGSLEGQTVVVSDGATVMLGPEECGDEPFLLASSLPGLIVVIGTDRHAAGMLAMQQHPPDLFILDDGFQHLKIYRDLNILLLDRSNPFGNGWTLPGGLLREPREAVRRADLVILTRSSGGASPVSLVPGRPCLAATYLLRNAHPPGGGKAVPLEDLKGARIMAVAAIAAPDSFFAALGSLGLDLVKTVSYSDHATYDAARIEELVRSMESCAADYLITTEKDGVKLKRLPPRLAAVTLAVRLDLEINDPALLRDNIRNLLQIRR